eukprot:TRINITY_DN3559_c0_g1_i13.p1 TRINITY_DN3559_c0_g1~~TRINITY_DN3559_c0_g1_i13.p1  ORF type:complete len:105 (-),score=20.54 TRINITY_DN3559_c0_g1_i13:112-426(-)
MIRRPPRSTHCISSAASDVYKRQVSTQSTWHQLLHVFVCNFNDNLIQFNPSNYFFPLDQIISYFFPELCNYLIIFMCDLISYRRSITQFRICLLYTSPSPRDQA